MHMRLERGERVLDVACGTGIVARIAAQLLGNSGQVTGLDSNAAMLAVARANVPSSSAQLEWRQGDAGTLPFPEGVFDVVLCQQGLQFFAEKLAALREMHRVLTPGGRLGICVWQSLEHDPYALVVSEALARHVSQEARELAAYSLGDQNDLHTLIVEAGFRDVEIRVETILRQMGPPEESIPLYLASSGRLGAMVAALTPDVRGALVADISAALQPYRHEQRLTIPRGTFIALAQR